MAVGSGGFDYNLHFWLGANTSQDEAGIAAFKTCELDQHLGDKPVQYRVVEGNESVRVQRLFCYAATPNPACVGFRAGGAVAHCVPLRCSSLGTRVVSKKADCRCRRPLPLAWQ